MSIITLEKKLDALIDALGFDVGESTKLGEVVVRYRTDYCTEEWLKEGFPRLLCEIVNLKGVDYYELRRPADGIKLVKRVHNPVRESWFIYFNTQYSSNDQHKVLEDLVRLRSWDGGQIECKYLQEWYSIQQKVGGLYNYY